MMELYQPKTDINVIWGSYDPDAKGLATFSVLGEVAEFVDPELKEFKREFLHVAKYATCETDYWRGDGSFVLMPDPPGFDTQPKGFWSKYVSGADGNFDSDSRIRVTFDSPRDFLGITLRFDQDPDMYPETVEITWYKGGAAAHTETFYPDSSTYFCEYMIYGCTAVNIGITKTAKPGRFARIIGLDFGEEHRINADLISCNVLEEFQPISAELPYNTLDFSFIDYDLDIRDFELLTLAFRERQPVRVLGAIDGQAADMGLFYVTSWDNGAHGVHAMKAKSILGVMDDVTFDGGVYTDISAGDLISQIFDKLDPYNTRYSIQTGLANELVAGWLPVLPMREALQQILFAIGGVADESRGDVVNMRTSDAVHIGTIGWDIRSAEQELKQVDVVTGIDLLSHNYTRSDDAPETVLIDDDFDVGIHRVEFAAPMYDRQIDFGYPENTVIDESENHITFEIKRADYVFMTGHAYVDTIQKHQYGETENMTLYGRRLLNVDNAYLVTHARAAAAAERVYNYYKNRFENNYSMRILPMHKVGQRWRVYQGECKDKAHALDGQITQMAIDCAGGFMANVGMGGGTIVSVNN